MLSDTFVYQVQLYTYLWVDTGHLESYERISRQSHSLSCQPIANCNSEIKPQ
jgi:hypothetical protein